jgi:hypothetical protein
MFTFKTRAAIFLSVFITLGKLLINTQTYIQIAIKIGSPMQVRCAVNSPYIYTFLPESLPADGNVEPGQLKDLNFLQCVVKVC